MSDAEKTKSDLSMQTTNDDADADTLHVVDEPSDAKTASLSLPSFLISDVVVVLLGVASIACIVGLTHQLILVWEITQKGRLLEMSMRAA